MVVSWGPNVRDDDCRADPNGADAIHPEGQPVGAEAPILDENELEDLVLAYSPRFRAILGKAGRQLAAGEGLSEEEFWGDKEAGAPSAAA
jgi:hypothetical protein